MYGPTYNKIYTCRSYVGRRVNKGGFDNHEPPGYSL